MTGNAKHSMTLFLLGFQKKRSTESMKRGTMNQSKAMECIRSLEFVVCCYECRMFGDKSTEWIGASPDGIGVLNLNYLDLNDFKEDLYEGTDLNENSNQHVNSEF